MTVYNYNNNTNNNNKIFNVPNKFNDTEITSKN